MIFLTGATGLVGSRLLYDLVSSGESVRALKRESSDMRSVNRLFDGNAKLRDGIEWVEGDVCDLFSLEEALSGIDTVYHSAAVISFHPAERIRMMKTNIEGTANMVNMSLKMGVKRFCHISSVAALSRTEGETSIDENSRWKISSRNSNYAISKYGAEREVWRGMEEGLSAFIINPSIILGPGDWQNGSPQMFSQVYNGLKFYTDGATGFVDVRDVSAAAIKLMELGEEGRRYIINAENVSYKFVFDRIAEHLGKSKPAYRVNKFMAEAGWRLEKLISMVSGRRPMITKETARNAFMRWNYSNEKIRKRTGINFISVEQSVKDTCAVFLREKQDKK